MSSVGNLGPECDQIYEGRELELEQRELLITLARLDDRFDAGTISAEDYRIQRESHKTELRDLMKEMETLK